MCPGTVFRDIIVALPNIELISINISCLLELIQSAILGYVAQRQRDNIKTRQREGIDSVLARGVKFTFHGLAKFNDYFAP